MTRPDKTASPRIPGERFLHAPGPTHIPAEVLNAMHRQPMDHADPRLDAVIANCESGLKRLLGTSGAELFLYAANGHGVWEAVSENLLAPGEAALVPATGHFSEQWALLLEATGRRAIRTPYRAGYPIDASTVEEALRADAKREIAAVFAVHTDTASGITHDIAAIRAAIEVTGHPALLVVDVIASLGATSFAMDALGVNVAVGASQKGLMSPPGLGFVAVDARTAADGREGLELQEGEPADVVVTDIFMPNQDGMETIHELRRKFPDTSIVVVSGGGSATSNIDYLHIARLLGATHTLQKPVQPDLLVDVVRGLARSPPAGEG